MSLSSNNEINRLGNRLRENDIILENDLELLHQFKASFGESFKMVMEQLNTIDLKGGVLNIRQVKTNKSIIAKLKRMPRSQLSRIQDIRGCRIIVSNLKNLKEVRAKIEKINWDNIRISERTKDNDSIGYRAVHIIVSKNKKQVEIQLRTTLQDLWANLCEKYSSTTYDLKYGNRNEKVKNLLLKLSSHIEKLELLENIFDNKKSIFSAKDKKDKEQIKQMKQELIVHLRELRS